MVQPKLSNLELQIMDVLWERASFRSGKFRKVSPKKTGPIQTTVYRTEAKKAARRVTKLSNAHMFDAVVSRGAAYRRVLDDIPSLVGGRTRLTLEDIAEARKALRKLAKEIKPPSGSL